ncbi:MAG: 4Fe-4S binding protein [Muribaculaceae bacterium]|nr:4Fe-4S binding protein [Muribaculaceae bacterium]
MKLLRWIRIVLSVAVLIVTTALIWLGSTEPSWLLTLDVLRVSLGALVGWLAVSMLLGRVYCSTACPIGTLQDAVAWLAKRVQHRGHGFYRYECGNWRLRIITLLLLAVSMTGDSAYRRISLLCDPTSLYYNVSTYMLTPNSEGGWWQQLLGGAALAMMIVLAAIMWMAWRGGRTFCNTVCPVGTVLGGVSQYSLMQLDIDPDLCVACGACERECKAGCVSAGQHTIDHSRCVMCWNCAASCPNHAIKYRQGRHRLTTPLLRRTSSQPA